MATAGGGCRHAVCCMRLKCVPVMSTAVYACACACLCIYHLPPDAGPPLHHECRFGQALDQHAEGAGGYINGAFLAAHGSLGAARLSPTQNVRTRIARQGKWSSIL